MYHHIPDSEAKNFDFTCMQPANLVMKESLNVLLYVP